MATDVEGVAPDILRLRIEALRKNLEQISGMRELILTRRGEVENLQTWAADTDAGIAWRLNKLSRTIADTHEEMARLQQTFGPQLEAPRRSLELAEMWIEQVADKFPRMVAIIEEMARRWEQIANERIPAGLAEESAKRIGMISQWEEVLAGGPAERERQGEQLSPEGIWDRYEEWAFGEGKALFGEYVDVIGGLALRHAGIDDGVCHMADDLIQCLSGDGRVDSMAMPTRRMAAEKTMARIVRLGFPEWTVWALPLGAHEFFHAVHSEQAGDRAAADWPELRELPRRLLDTYLADAYGAWVMGPSYACAAVLLSLDPCTAGREQREQAPEEPERTRKLSFDSRRVQVILEVLHQMDDQEGDVSRVATVLREAWSHALQSFGLSFESIEGEQALTSCARFMSDYLRESAILPASAEHFQRVANWESLTDHSPEEFPEQPDDVRDILNAAWSERLSNLDPETPMSAPDLADAARDLWRQRFGGLSRPKGEPPHEVRS